MNRCTRQTTLLIDIKTPLIASPSAAISLATLEGRSACAAATNEQFWQSLFGVPVHLCRFATHRLGLGAESDALLAAVLVAVVEHSAVAAATAEVAAVVGRLAAVGMSAVAAAVGAVAGTVGTAAVAV